MVHLPSRGPGAVKFRDALAYSEVHLRRDGEAGGCCRKNFTARAPSVSNFPPDLKEMCEALHRSAAFLGGQVSALGRLKWHRVHRLENIQAREMARFQERVVSIPFEGKHLGTDGS